jgi:N-acetylglucosamine-6-phosphate deacetylase
MPQSTYALDNADLWIGDGQRFPGHVVVKDGVIEAVGAGPAPAALPRVDLSGRALSPGLIDLMMLGGFGKSILRDDPLDIAREYLHLGVTACQLCIGTLPWASTLQVAENTRAAIASSTSTAATETAEVLGLYCEGPFQHPDLTGASLRENALPPTPENVRRVLDEMGDVVSMINVSPGTPGDVEAVAAFKAAGKVVSMAHSNAPAERVEQCLDAGTRVLGHVWDNNSGLIGDSGVQQPTLEHVALTDERVRFIHLIGDGVHVHPVLVRLVLRCRGIEALCLVTDAVPRAGCPDGEYIWDDGRRFYKEGGVGRTDKGGLNGSALLLPDMLRNLVKFTGLPPHEAIRAVTYNPAASLALDHRLGLLAPGRRADFVAWDERLHAQRVWHAGREVPDVIGSGEVEL